MTVLVSIDPGMSTGIFLGHYTDTQPLEKTATYQIEGGRQGLHDFLERTGILNNKYGNVMVISERFVPRPMRRSYKSDELEPLRIEGYLMAIGAMPFDYSDPRWGRPERMVIAGGSSTSQRKKAGDDKLREMGFWTLPKDVGMKDANDANAATKHAVGYMLQTHEPTRERYFNG